MGKRMVEEP